MNSKVREALAGIATVTLTSLITVVTFHFILQAV